MKFAQQQPILVATVANVLAWVEGKLEKSEVFFGHGSDSAWDEAVYLTLSAMDLPLDSDDSILHRELTSAQITRVEHWLYRRINAREPLPYITHQAWFCGLEFFVDERVLIPRSPIAELIQAHFKPWLVEEPQRILDVCTGGGCIALALAFEFPQARIDATDISSDALAVATINREKFALQNRVELLQGDLMQPVADRTYELIVANPPYVDAADMATLPAEFQHEPELALAAGSDGLALIQRLLQQAATRLTQNGLLVVEVGNSAEAMDLVYPELPLIWPELEQGGQGVFVLDAVSLRQYFVTDPRRTTCS